ncbi:methyltransferase, FkbM family [Salegentibacter agarivorans]|uniref:Methyltransferase, FkbM family n=2 Tax=Salegentibacter agarivorans TaxID=345907 RepID=A0A1I2LAV9_9FLAO|nr:methyltransferase, FkbM family [Salegentibacter agarivorans]
MRGVIKFLPKFMTERIKVFYYNSKQPGYKFSLKNNSYKTETASWSIFSSTPLYFITKEIERYEKYYKIGRDDTVIDAGAFNGILSLVYAEKAKSGKVFSFEPDRKNLQGLDENLNLNGNPKNIQLIKEGLWSYRGEIKFYEAGSVASSSFYKAEDSQENIISVTSLDNFVEENNIKKIDFIKMDVEGAELNILKGARKMLSNFKPNLSIATYHLVEGELTYKSVEEFFKEMNYPFETVFFNDGEIITYAGPQIEN